MIPPFDDIEYIKKCIYDHTGKLNSRFINFIKKEGVPDNLIPEFDPYTGYRCDWKIIGGEEARLYFEPYRTNITKKYFLTVDQKFEVQNWLFRTTNKLFKPEIMLKTSFITDRVRMRICVSLLDKLNIPKQYKDYIFDNLIYCYWIRRKAYTNFFWREIAELPF